MACVVVEIFLQAPTSQVQLQIRLVPTLVHPRLVIHQQQWHHRPRFQLYYRHCDHACGPVESLQLIMVDNSSFQTNLVSRFHVLYYIQYTTSPRRLITFHGPIHGLFSFIQVRVLWSFHITKSASWKKHFLSPTCRNVSVFYEMIRAFPCSIQTPS